MILLILFYSTGILFIGKEEQSIYFYAQCIIVYFCFVSCFCFLFLLYVLSVYFYALFSVLFVSVQNCFIIRYCLLISDCILYHYAVVFTICSSTYRSKTTLEWTHKSIFRGACWLHFRVSMRSHLKLIALNSRHTLKIVFKIFFFRSRCKLSLCLRVPLPFLKREAGM